MKFPEPLLPQQLFKENVLPHPNHYMTKVPYDFISTLAHLLPVDSIAPFTHLETKIWSHLGDTHLQRRKRYTLMIFAFQDHFCGVFLDSVTKIFVNSDLTKALDRFTRIETIMYLNGADAPTDYCNMEQIHFLRTVTECFLKAEYLCKRKVQYFKIFSALHSNVIWNFHFYDNPNIKGILIYNATYAYILPLLEEYHEKNDGEKKEIHEDNQNKGFEDLDEYGFCTTKNGTHKGVTCQHSHFDRTFVVLAYPPE